MADTHISVRGKFLFAGDEKFFVRGVTYGVFRPDAHGNFFPPPERVAVDFENMAAAAINAVRVYTPPPVWLLDLASRHGLYVMVGLPWEQHVAFLDQPDLSSDIERRVRSMVRESGNHPAILCYVLGNEIPATIVRWHGARRIERFIRRLFHAVKAEAGQTLVTYVNYPTTEYLHLPFLDFFCFNVYLEKPESLDGYIAQLQNSAGDRPLVLAEMGLDSRRNGEAAQSETLTWQIRTIFAGGCAGLFVFAWTDEWYRGGHDIDDWDFGLTRRHREPKPALDAVSAAFKNIPFEKNIGWPSVSVVVCTHNGARSLRDCLEGLEQLDYPQYEVIVVDDGSTDETASIAGEYRCRLIRLAHSGLGYARNAGMDAATGEIIAYTDDDARPDPHWLQYLAWMYLQTGCDAVGGPNVPHPEDGPVAECVANAPGGPLHVLLTHRDAEHLPGCNISFRAERLRAIGGFDTRFRTAGDDVDVCWRLQEQGSAIGFHAGAMVWHHRRNSIGAYWRQQKGYGRAEALLEAKWPSKYNSAGSVAWAGRLYGRGIVRTLRPGRVYQGVWGSAPFQRLYAPGQYGFDSPVLTIEWHLAALALLVILLSGPGVTLTLIAAPLAIYVLARLLSVGTGIAETPFIHNKVRYRLLTATLYILQPLARLSGRSAQEWLQKKQHRVGFEWSALRGRALRIWSEQWKAPEDWLRGMESILLSQGIPVRRGGDFDSWDLESPGILAGARLKLAIEDHGAGKQMLLFRIRPRVSRVAAFMVLLFTGVLAIAISGQYPVMALPAVLLVMLVLVRTIADWSAAAAALHDAVENLCRDPQTANEKLGGAVYLGSS